MLVKNRLPFFLLAATIVFSAFLFAASIDTARADAYPTPTGSYSNTPSTYYQFCVWILDTGIDNPIAPIVCFSDRQDALDYGNEATSPPYNYKRLGRVFVGTDLDEYHGWVRFLGSEGCVGNTYGVSALPTYFRNNIGSARASGEHSCGLNRLWPGTNFTGSFVSCTAFCYDLTSFGAESLKIKD